MSIAITTQIICFTILSLVILTGALGVVLLESIVYSAFLLGGVFMSVAGLYLLLNASFVAAAQILVYVGACLLYTSPSPRDRQKSRMPSSA